MKKNLRLRITNGLLAAFMFALLALPIPFASAQPFGKGVYGADVPFGSLTSLSIGLSNSVAMVLSPSGGNLAGTGSHVVTITSLDVVGYSLYINNPTNTDMVNGSFTIPASGNSTGSPLTLNTWGYNTTGSTTNFIGLTTSQVLLTDRTGPYKNGDDTTVTYGAYIDTTKGSGTYTVDVTYTAVGKS